MGFPYKAKGLSFVTPVAYDHRFAWAAIGSYYRIADEIILGLDRDRISWSGKYFRLDEDEFRRRLTEADPLGKISLVEADFHSQGSAPANDTFERNALSTRCKPGNWVVQIDSDELLQNPGEFRDWLLARRGPWRVMGRWTVVFKRFGDDYLVIDKDSSWISVATRRQGRYTGCRDTKEFKRRSPLRMLHFSWGRDEEELQQKLESWTHAGDFDTVKFLAFWKSVTLENYRQFRNFHPMDGKDWPSLRLIRKGDPDWVAAEFLVGAGRPAVFLDRDGTVSEEIGYIHRADLPRYALLPGVARALIRLKAAGYALVVLTNQSGVGRGYFGADVVDAVHERMRALLREGGAAVDAVYYCPHHPDPLAAADNGELPQGRVEARPVAGLCIDCDCRKPKPGLALQAARALGLDLAASWMIGDKTADLGLAASAGLKGGILVLTGHGPKTLASLREKGQAPPGDRVAADLGGAADIILGPA